ncbi:MAG: glycosyltransferase family 9 protein [Patescibacteria group bacterium]|jgi:lipopolysaccharide heptosyltransferase II
MKTGSWENVKKVLAVRLDSMGDLLMTTPALRAIKESLHTKKLVLLTSRSASLATQFIPEIDQTIVFDAPWVKTQSNNIAANYISNTIAKLKKEQFDAAIIFTVCSQNPLPAALLCYMSQIPLRLAYCHENPYALLTHWRPDPEPQFFIRHEVERQLSLVASVGYTASNKTLSLTLTQTAHNSVIAKLKTLKVDLHIPWVVLHPGVSEERRQYPLKNFCKALKELQKLTDFQILVTGNAAETELSRQAAQEIGRKAVSLGGQLTLEEFAALIALSQLLITNNTGPVHIAAAVGTPVVDLYANTNSQHTPWMVPNRVLIFDVPCKACERGICSTGPHHIQKHVKPREIVKASLELLLPKFKTELLYGKSRCFNSNT